MSTHDTAILEMEGRTSTLRSAACEGRGSVLLIDDDACLRETLAEEIARRGIVVTQESDGDDALRRIRDRSYDLVVTDLRLPGASGVMIARWVAAMRPGTRVVLMTAYPEWMVDPSELPPESTWMLVKPFDLDDLVRFVERAVECRRIAEDGRRR